MAEDHDERFMFPTLLQVPTRSYLADLGLRLGRPVTLDDVDEEELDQLAVRGFGWVWLMGVWQTGPAGRQVSLQSAEGRKAYRNALPDYTDIDVSGSPFAVQRYVVHADFGGNEALARLRERMQRRGLKLMLDYVPNHTALDHAWVVEHPEYYVAGTDADLKGEPKNFVRMPAERGGKVLAYGRDPNFSGWPDTLQLNFRHAGLCEAMVGELLRIAEQCDGVRCDMAMLLLPHIFRRTWGERSQPADGSPPMETSFWPEAIARVRAAHPSFLLLAEGYWNLEATLQLQGFDFTYDKTLYDRLLKGDVTSIREHLTAEDAYQRKCARFLENHDEERAAAVLPAGVHQAAAVLTYTTPGLRFFQEGQLDGHRIQASIHLGRRAEESSDPIIRTFYTQLLGCLHRHEIAGGTWRMLDRRPAWDGNPTWKKFFAYQWHDGEGRRSWVVVNYGPTQGQCYVTFNDKLLRGREFLLRDQMSRAWYQRSGNELDDRGLYLDMPAWGFHIFDVTAT